LFADYTVENDRFSGTSENLEGWLAGVEATLSIWDGGRIRGETAQAQSQYDQAKLREDALRLAIDRTAERT
jgi:outer membrane protein TolC